MAESTVTRRSSRFSMRSRQVGQLLVDNGDLQADQVTHVLKLQSESGGLFGQIARAQGYCADSAVSAALLKQVQVTDVGCDDLFVNETVSALVDRSVCETEKLCPFEKIGNMLCIVMGNPLNRRAITQIEESTHLKVKSFKSVWPKINSLIVRTYSGEGGDSGSRGEDQGLSLNPPDTEEIELVAPSEFNAHYAQSLSLDNVEAPMELQSIELQELPVEVPVQKAVSVGTNARQRSQIAPPKEARIQGLDTLHTDQAEIIETNRRGLVKRATRLPEAPAPKKTTVEKKAIVNVDLDALDLSQGEVVHSPDDAPEGMDEIQATTFVNKPLQRHAGAIIALTAVSDDYFYANGKCPSLEDGEVDEQLESLLDSLPLADTVAQSIGEYEATLAGVQSPPVSAAVVARRNTKITKPTAAQTLEKPRALELQPSPIGVMAALPLSEAEFKNLTATMSEDPVGEWDWNFASQGPIPVVAYEEN